MKSSDWYRRHQRDAYVKLSRQHNYRSRAVYKLAEIHQKTSLFNGVSTVIDLGAAPGSWSQYACECLPEANIIAIDILPVSPIEGVKIIQGDILEESTWQEVEAFLGDKGVDLILSDMSVNLSGIKMVDQAKSESLYDMLLECASTRLTAKGALVCKIFSGSAGNYLQAMAKEMFLQSRLYKPKASRSESSEVYLWAKNIANR